MRPCFTFTAKAGDKPALLAIEDEIGFWGVQAKDFRAALDAVEGDLLVVEINSPGGDVFAGLGMFNMLRTWAGEGKTLTTRVNGVAASIASVIMLAGDRREMPRNAFAMTHSTSTFAWGTAEDMRDAATTLDKIDGSIRGIYMDRMGVDEAKAKEIMAKDTWLTADECKDLGFVTEITDAVEATAKFDASKLDLPKGATLFKAKAADPGPPKVEPPAPEPEGVALVEAIVAKAKAAGIEAHAQVIALSASTMAEAEARINTARDIVALCNLVNRPDDAGPAIAANKSVAEFRAALAKAIADAQPEIDNSNPGTTKPTAATGGAPIDAHATWERRNQAKKSKGR